MVSAEEDKDSPNVVGAGVIVSSDVYKDIDKDPIPTPILNLRYKKFFISGKSLGYVIDEDMARRLDLFLEPRLMGYDSDEGHFLNGMEDRDYSLDGGIKMKQKISFLKDVHISLSAGTDILGKSNGQELAAGLGHSYRRKFFNLTSGIGLKWQSSDLADYYYGVKPSEAAASRPEYCPGSAVNYTAGLGLDLGISKNWILVMRAEYELFGDEIKDSPIVDTDHSISGLFGIAAMF